MARPAPLADRRARRAARRDRLAGRTAARAQERISYRLGPARPQEQDTMTPHSFRPWLLAAALLTLLAACDDGAPAPGAATAVRSEEHTSELQSLMRISYAVFCLKKKNNYLLQTKTSSTTSTA